MLIFFRCSVTSLLPFGCVACVSENPIPLGKNSTIIFTSVVAPTVTYTELEISLQILSARFHWNLTFYPVLYAIEKPQSRKSSQLSHRNKPYILFRNIEFHWILLYYVIIWLHYIPLHNIILYQITFHNILSITRSVRSGLQVDPRVSNLFLTILSFFSFCVVCMCVCVCARVRVCVCVCVCVCVYAHTVYL